MNSLLIYMAAMRFISSFVEFFAAIMFLRFNSINTALRINALLGLVGPLIFILVSFLGVLGVAEKISISKLLMILAGVILVFMGTNIK